MLIEPKDTPTHSPPKSNLISAVRVPVKQKCSKEVVKSAEGEWAEAFDEFWKEYPRKVCKFMARKSFMKIKPWSQDQCDAIFYGLEKWANCWRDNDIEMDYIPHASTWLNQRRWEDYEAQTE